MWGIDVSSKLGARYSLFSVSSLASTSSVTPLKVNQRLQLNYDGMQSGK